MVTASILVLVLVYLALALAAWCLADPLIFPAPKANYTPDQFPLRLQTADGSTIQAHCLRGEPDQVLVLYSHGNAEDLGTIEDLITPFAIRGYSVLAYEYPGYGHSPGRASEKSTCQAAEAALQYALETLGFSHQRIVLYGRSIGSGPSLYLATRHPVGGVILEGAFVSVFRVVTRLPLFPGDRFPNLKRIRQLTCPVLLIHGRRDRTVPFWHGSALHRAARSPKYQLWIDDAGHNNIIEKAGARYWQAIAGFITTVQSNQSE